MVALERRLALLDGAGGVAGDDRDVVEPGRLEVGQRDVEDRPVAVDRAPASWAACRCTARAAGPRPPRAPSRSLRRLLLVLVDRRLLRAAVGHPAGDRSRPTNATASSAGRRRRSRPGSAPAAREREAGEQPAVPAAGGAVEPARRRCAALAQAVDDVVVAERDRAQQRERGRARRPARPARRSRAARRTPPRAAPAGRPSAGGRAAAGRSRAPASSTSQHDARRRRAATTRRRRRATSRDRGERDAREHEQRRRAARAARRRGRARARAARRRGRPRACRSARSSPGASATWPRRRERAQRARPAIV